MLFTNVANVWTSNVQPKLYLEPAVWLLEKSVHALKKLQACSKYDIRNNPVGRHARRQSKSSETRDVLTSQ